MDKRAKYSKGLVQSQVATDPPGRRAARQSLAPRLPRL